MLHAAEAINVGTEMHNIINRAVYYVCINNTHCSLLRTTVSKTETETVRTLC